MSAEPPGAAGPADVVEELRALGRLALDRLEPLVARLAAGEWDGEHSCTSCPLCAAAAGLRGEHAEAVARHAAGLVAALRAADAESGPDRPAPPAGAGRVVQRIVVERGTSC
jgi:hypothetical protein